MQIFTLRSGFIPRIVRRLAVPALLLCSAVAPFADPLPDAGEECTIALIGGSATADGRPILWKNRDAAFLDNEIAYFNDGPHRYVTLINAGDGGNAWVGVNDAGFAVLNALSHNLPDTTYGGITNGRLMKLALQICSTVGDFRQLLLETNKSGRENPANLAVLDAAGNGAVFEAGTRSFVEFRLSDPSAAPSGSLVRTNFSLSGDTSGVSTSRYHRCRRIVDGGIARGEVSVDWIFRRVARDLRTDAVNPYPLPYEGAPPGYPKALGYVETSDTINRRTTVASAAILGILPGEDPLLSTFFGLFGQPVVGVPVPVWVAAGTTPPELDGEMTAPLCDLARERGRLIYDYAYNPSLLNTYKIVNNSRHGYMSRAERIQRWVVAETDRSLAQWREQGVIPAKMAAAEARIAEAATEMYSQGPPLQDAPRVRLAPSPNPTAGATAFSVTFRESPPAGWAIELFDIQGRRVRRIEPEGWSERREGVIPWDGRDDQGRPVPAGTYFFGPSGSSAAGGSITILR